VAPFLITSQEELQQYIDEDKSVMFPVKKVEIDVLARDVAGYGYETLWVRPGKAPAHIESDLKVLGNSIENEFYAVTVKANGTFDVLDKAGGDVYRGCNLFVDNADAGDTYNHSPVPGTELIHSTDCESSWSVVDCRPVKASLEVTIDMQLPACLEADRTARSTERVSCPTRTQVTLYSGVDRIDFETSYENRASDHRLRVHFPSGIRSEQSHACGQFDIVSRDVKVSEEMLIQSGEVPRADCEAEVTTYPQEYFVDVNNGRRGLAVLSKGLPEYEVIPDDGVVALTLERSVGKIARSDLLTRRGPSAPALAAPGAQCIRDFVFHYALVPHQGDQTNDHLLRQMRHYHSPIIAVQTDQHAGVYPGEMPLIEQSDSRVVVSAIKKCEREDALMVRLFNITDVTITTSVKINAPFAALSIANLNEESIEEHRAENGVTQLRFRPKEIKSLKISPVRKEVIE